MLASLKTKPESWNAELEGTLETSGPNPGVTLGTQMQATETDTGLPAQERTVRLLENKA